MGGWSGGPIAGGYAWHALSDDPRDESEKTEPRSDPGKKTRRLPWHALVVLFLAVTTIACGGGGGSGESLGTPVTSAVALEVTFPPGACCTDAVRVHVCGTATGGDGIAVLRVNGHDATTSDQFTNWVAEVDLAPGINDVRIECVTRDGDVVRDDGPAVLRFGRPLAPLGIGLDRAGDLLVLDSQTNTVVRVDPETGLESLVSGSGVGSGREIVHSAALAVTPNGKQALVFDFFRCQLLAADTSTGNREVVTSAGNFIPGVVAPIGGWDAGLQLTWPDTKLDVALGGSRVYIAGDRRRLVAIDIDAKRWWDYAVNNASPSAVAVDAATERIFLAEIRRNELSVYRFDGTSAVLSPGASAGRLDLGFAAFPAMVFDAARNSIWLVAADRRGFVLIDADSGARTAFRTHGSDLREVSDMVLDNEGGRMLVASEELGRIWEVSLATGESRPLRNFDLGSGPEIGRLGAGVRLVGDRVLVLDTNEDGIVSVDIGTARRRAVAPLDSSAAFDVTADEHTAVTIEKDTVHVVNLVTGASHALPSGGHTFVAPVSVSIDTARNEAIVLDTGESGGVIAVDLTTGQRRTIAVPTVGPRQSSSGIHGTVAVDSESNRALVSDPFSGTVIAYDLANGSATTLVKPAAGHGVALFMPAGLACEPTTGAVYATALQLPALVRIEAGTDERVLISGRGRGSGPAFVAPVNVTIDGPRAIVTDGTRVFAVDLQSGDRVFLSR